MWQHCSVRGWILNKTKVNVDAVLVRFVGGGSSGRPAERARDERKAQKSNGWVAGRLANISRYLLIFI